MSRVTEFGPGTTVGFFTDTSVCIGCKACEVACKEWNGIEETISEMTGKSYDNTAELGADAWRHVAFIEQRVLAPAGDVGLGPPSGTIVPFDAGRDRPVTDAKMDAAFAIGQAHTAGGPHGGEMRWLMASDVCKHCTHAACLDVCPTGSLFRTEFDTVVVQEDICNGCGYCISACPYGVIGQRSGDGRAWKCTMCYDRLVDDMTPACAQACPTDSILFGDLDQLRIQAAARLDELQVAGVHGARLYGEDPDDGVGGAHAFFLLLDEPEVYGLPPDPIVPTRDLASMWRSAAAAAVSLVVVVAGAVAVGSRAGGSGAGGAGR